MLWEVWECMHEETKVEIRKQGCPEMPMKPAVSLEACHSLVSSLVIESFSLHPGSWDHSVLSLPVHSRCTQRHKFGTGFVMKVCQCFRVFMIKRKTIVVDNPSVHILEFLPSWCPSVDGPWFRIPLYRKCLGGRKHRHFTVVLTVSRTVPGIEQAFVE